MGPMVDPIFDIIALLGDYACSTDINKLLQLQNCVARLVGYRNFSTLSRSLVKKLDWNEQQLQIEVCATVYSDVIWTNSFPAY